MMNRWLGTSPKVYVTGTQHLADQDVVLVIEQLYEAIFTSIYHEEFKRNQDLQRLTLVPRASGPGLPVEYPENCDLLLPVSSDADAAKVTLSKALSIARASDRLVIPVGVSSIPAMKNPMHPEQFIALPGSRSVVVIEAPFRIPDQPEIIPPTWMSAILTLLQKASGQAKDMLATWKQNKLFPSE